MSSRPGRVVSDIPIEAGYPRNEEYRMSALYIERCRLASAALRLAMSAGESTS
jgi:NitT/TauT family transport system ATP-binding protein